MSKHIRRRFRVEASYTHEPWTPDCPIIELMGLAPRLYLWIGNDNPKAPQRCFGILHATYVRELYRTLHALYQATPQRHRGYLPTVRKPHQKFQFRATARSPEEEETHGRI